MNQGPGDFDAAYLGLQGFELVAVEQEQDSRRGRVKIVKVQRREARHECSDCGRRHDAGLLLEIEPIRLRDCSIGDAETYVEVRSRARARVAAERGWSGCRSRCRSCG